VHLKALVFENVAYCLVHEILNGSSRCAFLSKARIRHSVSLRENYAKAKCLIWQKLFLSVTAGFVRSDAHSMNFNILVLSGLHDGCCHSNQRTDEKIGLCG
jgi:hypothetical protein